MFCYFIKKYFPTLLKLRLFFCEQSKPLHGLFNAQNFCYNNYNKTEKTFKNEQRSKDAATEKRPTTSGVGKINNYYEDIYIPPYNNTDSPHLYIVTIPIDSTH